MIQEIRIILIIKQEIISDDKACDLIYELKIKKFTLPYGVMYAIQVFEHMRDIDCYPTPLLIASYLVCL